MNINAPDYDKRTALHLAAAEGRREVVEYLVAQGADVNARDRWGDSPLIEAVRHRHTGVATFLVANGAQVDLRTTSTSGMVTAAGASIATSSAADVSSTSVQWKRINIALLPKEGESRVESTAPSLKAMLFPSSATLQQLHTLLAQRFKLAPVTNTNDAAATTNAASSAVAVPAQPDHPPLRLLTVAGAEIDDVSLIRDDDVLYVQLLSLSVPSPATDSQSTSEPFAHTRQQLRMTSPTPTASTATDPLKLRNVLSHLQLRGHNSVMRDSQRPMYR